MGCDPASIIFKQYPDEFLMGNIWNATPFICELISQVAVLVDVMTFSLASVQIFI
jgi:hypothetical protein